MFTTENTESTESFSSLLCALCLNEKARRGLLRADIGPSKGIEPRHRLREAWCSGGHQEIELEVRETEAGSKFLSGPGRCGGHLTQPFVDRSLEARQRGLDEQGLGDSTLRQPLLRAGVSLSGEGSLYFALTDSIVDVAALRGEKPLGRTSHRSLDLPLDALLQNFQQSSRRFESASSGKRGGRVNVGG